jgi:predicted peptidase
MSRNILALLTMALLGTVGRAAEQPAQQAKKFEQPVTFTARLNYLVFLPAKYERGDEKWPLLLFLHGSGETGDDIEKVKIHGPPKIVGSQPDFPFVVVSPQTPIRTWIPEVLGALLDEVVKQYRIDEDRIYITGLSMGGAGTWNLAAKYPQRFAAIAPICGSGRPEDAARLKDLPIWAFHGALDSADSVERHQAMVDAVKQAGGNVRYTIYPDLKHDCWTVTYDNPELYQWLLEHRRKK